MGRGASTRRGAAQRGLQGVGPATEADWSTLHDGRAWYPPSSTQRWPVRAGPDAVGSDWPVSLLAAPYQSVVDTARALLAGLSDDERAAVMGGTAAEVYDLRID